MRLSKDSCIWYGIFAHREASNYFTGGLNRKKIISMIAILALARFTTMIFLRPMQQHQR